ncbi:hypothetical protein ACM64Y_01855 [Novispirillum sp. DQ9]|uniref:hypothetical protein n=1 Tax=Novispirillum sp. DQ9 TaxID=3398612 RepID=UPI003C7BCCA7
MGLFDWFRDLFDDDDEIFDAVFDADVQPGGAFAVGGGDPEFGVGTRPEIMSGGAFSEVYPGSMNDILYPGWDDDFPS